MALWSDDITLTLTIGGNPIGNDVIASASWRLGRTDWFGSLSPGTASFTLRGDHTGTIDPGDAITLKRGSDTLWSGKVDTVSLDQEPLRTGETLDTTTVTGADFVAQLGEAKVKGLALAEDTMEAQLEDVLAEAGYTTTVTRAPSTGSTYLAMDASYTGSVMDWIETAERGANCITAWMPDGEVRVCRRASFPDYGQRIWDSDAAIVNMPGLPLASSLWRMDEGSGNIVDLINARDGTAGGTPTYGQTGPWGASGPDAIGFTKADAADKFTISDNYDLADVNTTSWTIAGWVYWDGSGASDAPIMTKQAAGPSGWQWRVTTTGRLRFFANNAGSTVLDVQSGVGTIPANTWTHVAIVRSGTQAWTVINGTFTNVATLTGTIPDTAVNLIIGTDGGSNWFGGRMCMLSVWNKNALSAALSKLIYLDYVTLPSPRTWRTTRSIANVINHWLVGGNTFSDATSIATYGRRTWDADDSTSLVLPIGPYYSNLRTVMKDPRPIVTATYSVTSTSSPLITIAPLQPALHDGTLYQVLEVAHDISVDRWDVTLILDRTQSDLTDDVPILPV